MECKRKEGSSIITSDFEFDDGLLLLLGVGSGLLGRASLRRGFNKSNKKQNTHTYTKKE